MPIPSSPFSRLPLLLQDIVAVLNILKTQQNVTESILRVRLLLPL